MKKKVVGIFVCTLLIATVLPISAQLKINEIKNDYQTNLLNDSWYATYGGKGNDGFYAVQQAPDGGYVAAGLTNSIGAGSYDAWLVKTDSAGTPEWEKTFGGTGDDRFHQIQRLSDGYIIAGRSDGDIYVVKVDDDGNESWSRTYGGNKDDYAYGIWQTNDTGYIVTGITESYAPQDLYHMWVIKTDENGNEIWNETYGRDNYFSECKGARQTSDGGYILTGQTWLLNEWCFWYLVKTDEDGNELWNKTFEGTHDGVTVSIEETADGDFIISGSKGPLILGIVGCNAWLIKIDIHGNIEFEKQYGYKLISDTFWCAIQTDDGGYIGTGSRLGLGSLLNIQLPWFPLWSKICVLKVDADGNQEWGGSPPRNGVGRFIRQTSDDGYIVSGYTRNYPNFGDGVLFTIDSEGNFP
ncbi:MAG: hypothetical protein JSW60_07080 [Thermoplasmatales archaeon]|nr:MAG: hypothetical protein JSW60_07080 [Thermoplasmatales archaeon]